MSNAVPRQWEQLHYLDPERTLVGLRNIALTHPLHELSYSAASLRTRELRKYGEGRQAALFSYGMGQALGVPIGFAQHESGDHDIVVRYFADGVLHYVPVQLKEWVPDHVNPRATLQTELDKLNKYMSAGDLTVAFHLNRETTVHLSELEMPTSGIRELWFFGAKDSEQERWWLIGNLLSQSAKPYEFSYPST